LNYQIYRFKLTNPTRQLERERVWDSYEETYQTYLELCIAYPNYRIELRKFDELGNFVEILNHFN